MAFFRIILDRNSHAGVKVKGTYQVIVNAQCINQLHLASFFPFLLQLLGSTV